MIKKPAYLLLMLNILVNKLTSNIEQDNYIKIPENYQHKVNYLIENNSEDLIKGLKLNPDCNFRLQLFEEKIRKECIKCYGKEDAKNYMIPMLNEYIEKYLILMPEYVTSHKEELAYIFNIVETLYNIETYG